MVFTIFRHYLFLSLLIGTKDEERQKILDYPKTFNLIIKSYDVYDFKYDALMSKFIFYMRLKLEPLKAGYDFPTIIQYDMTYNTKSMWQSPLFNIIQNELFKSTQHDDESIRAIFAGLFKLKEIQSILSLFDYSSTIHASAESMKAISRSEFVLKIIRDFEMRFELIDDHDGYTKIFSDSVRILVGHLIYLPRLSDLLSFKSANQVKNIEEFLGQNVAEIFLNSICPYLSEFYEKDIEELYYVYREAVLYWLHGPHRLRLLELRPKFTVFLEKLALEVELEDSRLLLQISK
jgi:hypothetical protein